MGLYDKIRKKKKENLEKIYKDLSHPTSMTEALSSPVKFKSVTGTNTGAYESATTIDPDASTKSGEEIVNTIKDEGKCVEGFWVGGENNGEECSEITPDENLDKLDEAKKKLSDFKGSRDDVNPDMPEGEKGLFGKQKGGSALGNIIRKIVGKTGEAEILDAAPFKRNGVNDNLTTGGGNTGGTGDAGAGASGGGSSQSNQVMIGDKGYNIDYSGPVDAKDGKCPEGLELVGDKCVQPTEVNPNAGKADDEDWIKTCQENPCLKPCHEQFGQCKDEVIPGDDGQPSNISATEIPGTEEEVPGEVSQNMSFADQLRTNWGQNLLDKRTQNREKKELKHNKRDFTGNQKDLFQEARKSLRQSGDLPGSKDEKLRAIYNEMDRLNALRDPKTQLEGTFGNQRSMYDIAQGVKDGTGLSYKELVDLKDDKGNRVYSDEELEQIRDLTDNQGRKGSSEYQRTDEITLPPEIENNLSETERDLIAGVTDIEEVKKILLKHRDAEAAKNNTPPDSRGDHTVYSKPPTQIKPGGFKMKRGKLIRPGY